MDAAPAGDRSIAPKPSGDSISPLEAHAAFLFTLIARQPDLALDEIVAAMHKRRIAGSRNAVWRFLQRHKIGVKKKSAGGGARAGGPGAHAGAGCESKVCLTQPDWCFSTRTPPRPIWCGFAAAVRVASA
jgi:hypothetical protein